jgi:hypothetical protein
MHSPFQFAKDECANFNDSNGSCLGLTADSLRPQPGIQMRARPLPRCVLADGQRCDYFERIVLPMAERGNARFLQARETYYGSKALRTAGGAEPKTCPECGNPRATGHRFCEDCKKAKRKASYRASKQQPKS